MKPVPVMVVPPAVGPEAGSMAVTVGTGAVFGSGSDGWSKTMG